MAYAIKQVFLFEIMQWYVGPGAFAAGLAAMNAR
jgi:hypothetical protein